MRWKSGWPLFWLSFVGGCEWYLGVGETYLQECVQDSDCQVQDQECQKAACRAHLCEIRNEPSGTRLPEQLQKTGDCAEYVCNGAGQRIAEPELTDADDGDACTIDWCREDLMPPEPAHMLNADAAECACGNGEVSSVFSEECDDGNRENFDGCSADCKLESVTSVVAGAFHTCVLVTGGHVKCWGRNDYGQLGIGDRTSRGDKPDQMGSFLPAVDLGKGHFAKELAAGAFHTCALLEDQSVTCWGLNGVGQLGFGDTKTRGDKPNDMGEFLQRVELGGTNAAKHIAAGAYHTCVLLTDDTVKCWGANASGQLGQGDKVPRGNDPNQMVKDLSAVDLGVGMVAKTIVAGDYFTCALLENGAIKCWGANVAGQLGLGDTQARGDEPEEMGDKLTPVLLGNTVMGASFLATGSAFACAWLVDYGLKCWGANAAGQLGLGDTKPRGTIATDMGDALPIVDVMALDVLQVAAGDAHTCVLFPGGVLKCWGRNASGQLGQGDVDYRGDDAGELGNGLSDVLLDGAPKMIASGAFHVCALLIDGRVKCWGDHQYGQLGTGPTGNLGDEPNEMGKALPAVKILAGGN